MRRLAFTFFALVALLAALAVLDTARAAKSFKMTTVVEDFVTTKWVFNCPPKRTVDMSQTNMTEKGWMDFFDCLRDIESENGLSIKSKTKVRNKTTESDKVTTVTTLAAEQAQKLCDIIDANPLPPSPAIPSRPHIQELSVDGVIDKIVIDLGDGCLIDLTKGDIPANTLQQVFGLLNQFATQNGTRVSATSKAGRKTTDRVQAITYLTPDQIQQVLQLLANNGVGVDLQRKIRSCVAIGKLTLNGKKRKVKLAGEIVTQPGQQPPQNPGEFPIEIVSMGLHGEGSPIGLMLPPQQVFPGLQGIDPQKPKRVHTQLQLPFVVEIDGVDAGSFQAPLQVEGLSKRSAKKPLKLKGQGDVPFGGEAGPGGNGGSFKLQKLAILPTTYLPVFQLQQIR